MARISNTTAYPNLENPTAEDYVILTDQTNNNLTKTCTLGDVQGLFGIDTLVAHVEVTSAELLALNTTSKTLIAAPGAGKVIDLISLNTYLDAGNVAYDFGNDLNFSVGAYTIATMPLAAANNTVDEVRKINIIPGSSSSLILEDNVVLLLETGANPTAGNGVLYCNIFYRILTVGTTF